MLRQSHSTAGRFAAARRFDLERRRMSPEGPRDTLHRIYFQTDSVKEQSP